MNKRIFLICSFLAVSLALAACSGIATPSVEVSSAEMMDGGYTEQRELTGEDIALFESVMGAMDNGKTYEPVTVATQVVAGTNYRFAAKVTENGNTTNAFVVIFQPLANQGDPEFVSEDC